MCGISGVISKRPLSPKLEAAATRMSYAQIHRGPDGDGQFTSERVIFSSRRLSIIDPLSGGQPLYNKDRSLVLVFNGEIYNYVELRDTLKASGNEFLTETDGEVILHLYQQNPNSFIEQLRGMFAFVLYDIGRGRVILARDRMGEKPLYLFESEGEIIFASEMKSLLSSHLIPFELDPNAIDLFFHYQYVPEPLTAIKGVRKLDAATILTIDTDEWKTEEQRYWRMSDAPPIEGCAGDVIYQKLEEVSKVTLRSDVPVGVALSGGLDSSIVAALAAKHKPDICAFSVGYSGRPESDERSDAKKLARYLEIPFIDIELETKTVVDLFPELNFWRDDPIADIAGFGYYSVMQLARENRVPVILQGQGGDELFWGYPQLKLAARENFNKAALLKNPFSQKFVQSIHLRSPQDPSIHELSRWLRDLGGVRSNRRLIKQQLATRDRLSFYDKSVDFIAAATSVKNFYTRWFAGQIGPENAYSHFNFTGDWDEADIALTELVCSTYLRENGITQGDRLGMASSVELRLPLIDYQFVETVIGLRKSQTDIGLAPKKWLKDAARNFLPDGVLDRPKRGFAPPTREWHDALFAAYGDSLRDGFLVGAKILTPDAGRQLSVGEFSPHESCPISFKALVLEQWCRQMQNICSE